MHPSNVRPGQQSPAMAAAAQAEKRGPGRPPGSKNKRAYRKRSAAHKLYGEMENLGFKDQRILWELLLPDLDESQRTIYALEMVKRIWAPEE